MFLAPVAAPKKKTWGTPAQHKVFRAERMRIDYRKNFKFSLNFPNFKKIFFKTFKYFLKALKIFN